MGPIKAADKPDACTCDWEEVSTFTDTEPMIERTRTNPECACVDEATLTA